MPKSVDAACLLYKIVGYKEYSQCSISVGFASEELEGQHSISITLLGLSVAFLLASGEKMTYVCLLACTCLYVCIGDVGGILNAGIKDCENRNYSSNSFI